MKDPQTNEILTRLNGGWPTKLELIDEKQFKDRSISQAPPGEGISIVWRVAKLRVKEVKSKQGIAIFQELGFTSVLNLKDPQRDSKNLGEALHAISLERLRSAPDAFDALDLLVEDYARRKHPDLVCRFNSDPTLSYDDYDNQEMKRVVQETKLTSDPEEAKRSLEQRMDEFSRKSRDAYGTFPGKK